MRDATNRWVVLGLCCAALLLVGCGDDDGDDPSPPDAGGAGGSGGSSSDAGRMPLPDDTAGKPCTSDAECGGGRCADQLTGVGLVAGALAAPGGYCTATCMSDVDCGGGGACILTIGMTVTGQCFATCEEMADCREGYQCGGGLELGGIVVPDTCRPAPATDQLDDGVAGDMCSEATDCPGGTCLSSRMTLTGNTELPGGYCSGRCIEDAHCGEGGVCLPSLLGGAGSCYQACAEDSECTRDGYRCRLLGEQIRGCNPAQDPLPDGTAGDACTSDADCGGAAGTCRSTLPQPGITGLLGETLDAPGGYCSQACAEDSDCGEGGVCTGVLGSGYCFKPCASEADCRDGYACDDRQPGAGGAASGDAGTNSGTVCTPEAPPDDADAGAG
jgi:Cys-rich repeat protein